MRRKRARREDLGLTRAEFAILRRLNTPQKIQLFVNAIPANHEIGGETILSVRQVLRQRRAHCIEGAFVAACALWIHDKPPLVMFMDCDASDFPHDPVYRSLRELAMSYFHEYFDKRGRKTLRSYSGAFDLRRIDPTLWVTSEKACQEVNDRLTRLRRYSLVSSNQARLLSRRDNFEREAAKLVQYPQATPPAWRG